MDELRRIDRENDRYDEVVRDPRTGDIIHETHEPLSERASRSNGLAGPSCPQTVSYPLWQQSDQVMLGGSDEG